MVVVAEEVLRELATETLKAVGTEEEEAMWVAECLVLSNLKGVDSHGIQQIPSYVKYIKEGYLKPGARPVLLREMGATSFFDGGWGYGYTIAKEAMMTTIEKAKKFGIAYTGIQNIHHIGRVGKWAEIALEEDMIGFASQPGGVFTAPWGGRDRKLPIAPIAVAIPAGSYPPIVIDMSLGPISMGRTAILALRDMKVPLGWYIDDEGEPTDDPKVFRRGEGAQLPLGQAGLGYKGMALSMIIDILAGPLLGLMTNQVHAFRRRGVFLGAINIEAFTTIDHFKECMDSLIADLKSSRLAEGFDEILMPGEPEWREMEKRRRENIFIDDEIYQRILDTAEQVGVGASKYKGNPGKTEITHPSYTLEYRYE